MGACIRHRGPDDEGIWTEPSVGLALAFRRLAIVDLSDAGHQPMQSPSGRFTLVFNGEVYNHAELRMELERDGWRFRGHSDTEVICAAFERWGIDAAVPRFIGMFAIAAWDAGDRTLSLIRDRLGIKPLYYYHQPGIFLFGSELKSLLACDEFDRTLSDAAMMAFLRYLYIPAPLSIFEHARKLLPGCILRVGEDAAIRDLRPYWSVDAVYDHAARNVFDGSDEDGVEQLESLLRDAVRLRMRADVPMGALLSGGIDSSLVVALMQAEASQPVRTFSIGFPDTPHDEAIHAAEISRRLGTRHTELALTGSDVLDVVPLLPEMFDEPFADPSQIPTYLVSRMARQDVTVALSGDGGDELFAGYSRYVDGERIILNSARLPRVLRQLAATTLGAIGPQGWERGYQFVAPLIASPRRVRLAGQKSRKLSLLLCQDSEAAMYRSLLSAWQNPAQFLERRVEPPTRIDGLLTQHGQAPLLDRMMLLDQQTYLADDLLAKVDRASMAVSLEARVPLLDHRVVEFSWRLPRRFKIRDGRGKWILRQVLYKHVEPALVDRPKVGFSVPLEKWLRGDLREWSEELIFSPTDGMRERLNASELARVWKRFQAGDDEPALAVWAVTMLQQWAARWCA